MCGHEICPCRYHSIKIQNDFFDIFDEEYTFTEEREIVERVIRETRNRKD